jgi:DNA ligase (NAD+)
MLDVDALAARLEKASKAYYNNDPIMSDADFDRLVDRLRAEAPTHPFLAQVGAPVDPSSGWAKVTHRIPMGSLNKAQTLDEFKTWWGKCGLPRGAFCMVEKMDGISIALHYEDGDMVQALTRGDGSVGEDITRNVKLMKGFPLKYEDFTGDVRGEIVVLKSDHKKHFPNDSNPRNTASGTSKRQSDPDPCRHLTIFAYELLPSQGSTPHTKSEEINQLASMGFTVPNWNFDLLNTKEADNLYQMYVDSIREGLDYDIDGLVFFVDDNEERDALGDLNSRPKGAVAFKFPHEEKVTELRDIVWQVGKSGRLTPVAIFDTVDLAGAKVSRASLHNVSNLKRISGNPNGMLSMGDKILVSRRNDVIPYVEKLVESTTMTATHLSIPTKCPECDTTLQMQGEFLVCVGDECPSQKSGAIKRWLNKTGALGWGSEIVDSLCAANKVMGIEDLYDLMVDEFANHKMKGRRVGESTATKLLTDIHGRKELPLHVLVGALGIPMVARSMCKTIVDAGFDTIDKMKAATVKQIEAIPGVGFRKAMSFVDGLEARANLLDELDYRGIVAKAPSDGPFKGKAICMTGFRDPRMVEAIEEAGGTVKSGVSKKLDILVARDATNMTGKLKKAQGYGVEIIDIDEMWSRLGGQPDNRTIKTTSARTRGASPNKPAPKPKPKKAKGPTIMDLFGE